MDFFNILLEIRLAQKTRQRGDGTAAVLVAAAIAPLGIPAQETAPVCQLPSFPVTALDAEVRPRPPMLICQSHSPFFLEPCPPGLHPR